MGKINGFLKWVFIIFNILFLILGCAMIAVAAMVTASPILTSEFGGPGVGWLWVITIGIFGISSLGIYAACSEKSLFLSIFAGFIGVGMIIMLILGIVAAVIRDTVKKQVEQDDKEIADVFMKRNITRAGLEILQQSAHCCGVISADDWGTKIPPSCECTNADGKPTCKARPAGSTGPNQIYAKPCKDIIFREFNYHFKIVIGILFGFGVIAVSPNNTLLYVSIAY
ncbi:tetraspanin-8 [Fundulus heteroclitus]|uniref:tetraspanin-8 n=1 Tax=Fundulus heteroclitus TaxID=8078 RepID=UPI00165B991B|nr:tetraspanin-8 [Fundulus heteroclitus]